VSLSSEHPPSSIGYDDGERSLLLRAGHVSDVPELVDAIHDSLSALKRFMPWAHLPQTHALQQERLSQLEASIGSGTDLIFHLFEKPDGPLLGCIGMHGARVLNPLGFEIGYWTRSSAQKRGLATLAAQCVVVTGFECFGAQRIQCAYNEANLGSRRVTEKVGFVPEGRLRNLDPQPTLQMREDGCEIVPFTIVAGLWPEQRDVLPWYQAVAAATHVLDRQGEQVWPPRS
jgi:RimJ/RimL family protein N-acetyltransferase